MKISVNARGLQDASTTRYIRHERVLSPPTSRLYLQAPAVRLLSSQMYHRAPVTSRLYLRILPPTSSVRLSITLFVDVHLSL